MLPADVYDTLEFASLAFGGIKGGVFCELDITAIGSNDYIGIYNLNCPNCAHGLLMSAENIGHPYSGEASRALRDIGIAGGRSDAAVEEINQRKGFGYTTSRRVTFREWCAELEVVRGE